jgi:hypothetical protein
MMTVASSASSNTVVLSTSKASRKGARRPGIANSKDRAAANWLISSVPIKSMRTIASLASQFFNSPRSAAKVVFSVASSTDDRGAGLLRRIKGRAVGPGSTGRCPRASGEFRLAQLARQSTPADQRPARRPPREGAGGRDAAPSYGGGLADRDPDLPFEDLAHQRAGMRGRPFQGKAYRILPALWRSGQCRDRQKSHSCNQPVMSRQVWALGVSYTLLRLGSSAAVRDGAERTSWTTMRSFR